jgi:hypothetical protein
VATRRLYLTFAAAVLLAASLAVLLSQPGSGLKPARRTSMELDEPTPAHGR